MRSAILDSEPRHAAELRFRLLETSVSFRATACAGGRPASLQPRCHRRSLLVPSAGGRPPRSAGAGRLRRRGGVARIKRVARDASVAVERDGTPPLMNDPAKQGVESPISSGALTMLPGDQNARAGSFALLCSRRDLFDDRPIVMIAAQLIWCTLPRRSTITLVANGIGNREQALRLEREVSS